MKSSLTYVLFLLTTFSGLAQKTATLKNTNGKEITVQILDGNNESVQVSRKGKTFNIPWDKLAPESIEMAKAILEAPPSDEEANQRKKKDVVLHYEHTSPKTVTIPSGERIDASGNFDLYVGETIHLEFQKNGETLSNPKVVSVITAPERSITFSMMHESRSSVLKRKTAIPRSVKMKAAERIIGDEIPTALPLNTVKPNNETIDNLSNETWHVRFSEIEVAPE